MDLDAIIAGTPSGSSHTWNRRWYRWIGVTEFPLAFDPLSVTVWPQFAMRPAKSLLTVGESELMSNSGLLGSMPNGISSRLKTGLAECMSVTERHANYATSTAVAKAGITDAFGDAA